MVDTTALAGTWTLDPAHTRIGFSARHAMVTKVRGNFDQFEGTVVAEGETAQVNVTVQAASINTNNQMRDDHLRNNDFLEVDTYPTITFASTAVEFVDDETLRVTGDLTIKATTKSITIDFEFAGLATDPYGNVRAGFEGETSILRSEYGVAFNAALETGGVLVSDKVNIDIEVSAIKAA